MHDAQGLRWHDRYFNSRSPYGERYQLHQTSQPINQFQLTLPIRGAISEETPEEVID